MSEGPQNGLDTASDDTRSLVPQASTAGLRQRAFLNFVLAQYVTQGVYELDQEKLTPLLKLKYGNAIADAVDDLGSPEQIRVAFVGFQRYLYQGEEPQH